MLLLLLVIAMASLAVLNSGCSSVQIKNDTLYFPIGSDGGALVEHTLDSTQAEISNDQMKALLDSGPMVMMSTDAYGNMKKNYETLCSDLPLICSWEVQQKMDIFFRQTDKFLKAQKKAIAVHAAKKSELEPEVGPLP